MNDYHLAQITTTDAIQATGPLYAAEFTRLTGTPWHYVDPRKPDDPDARRWSHSYQLVQTETGLAVTIYVDTTAKRAGASPSLPVLPNGGKYGTNTIWREWHFKSADGTEVHKPEAGVSYDRFLTAIQACAKRFVTMVYMPYAEVWPQVAQRIEEKASGYQEMERVAALLASEFNGRLSEHNRSDSTRTVYFSGNLPAVSVSFGGHLRVEHPSFTLETFRAYARATLEVKGIIR